FVGETPSTRANVHGLSHAQDLGVGLRARRVGRPAGASHSLPCFGKISRDLTYLGIQEVSTALSSSDGGRPHDRRRASHLPAVRRGGRPPAGGAPSRCRPAYARAAGSKAPTSPTPTSPTPSPRHCSARCSSRSPPALDPCPASFSPTPPTAPPSHPWSTPSLP